LIAAIAEVFEFRPDWHRQNQAVQLVRQYDLKLTSILESQPRLRDCVAHCCHCGIRFLTYRCNRRRRDLRCPFGCREHHRRAQANARSRKYYQTPQGKQRKEERNALRSPIDQPELTADHESSHREPALHEHPPHEPARESLPQQEPQAGEVPPSAASLEPPSASHPAPSSKAPSERLAASHENEHDNRGLTDLSPTDTWSLELAGVTLTHETLANSPVLTYLCHVVGMIEKRTITRKELLKTLRQSLRQRSLTARARREYVLSYLNEHPPP
jgi:hypothetical protein